MSASREWDRSMMARVQIGDDLALAAIVDRYGGAVHATARHVVGDDQADDVVQDVMLDLWRRPERYDADLGDLCAFLVVNARRRAIDVLRSRQRRSARERRAVTDELPIVSCESEALASLVGGQVRAAMRTLPDDQRRAVELAYLGGLTYRGVARAMGTSEGTAKSRLRLGMARLARELESEHEVRTEPAWS